MLATRVVPVSFVNLVFISFESEWPTQYVVNEPGLTRNCDIGEEFKIVGAAGLLESEV